MAGVVSRDMGRDTSRYEKRSFMGLPWRTLACASGAVASCVAVANGSAWLFGFPTDATYVAGALASAPFWVAAFWRPKGLLPEEWVPLWARQTFGPVRLKAGKRMPPSLRRPRSAAEQIALSTWAHEAWSPFEHVRRDRGFWADADDAFGE